MIKIRDDLELLRLKENLNYCPDTGVFTWKIKKTNNIVIGQVAGSVSADGHIRIKIDNKLYMAHRLAWLFMFGEYPKYQIDHINGVPYDNRIDNLREATHTENMRNLSKYSRNTSGRTGVAQRQDSKKWRAYISHEGIQVNLGSYALFEDACEARSKAEILYGYHENHGRDGGVCS